MPNIWFTADSHLSHANIIKYCNRPFKNCEEMDECIIQRFNEVLHPGDVLYHLGDVAWSSYPIGSGFLDRLNIKEVHLILGNHDKENRMREFKFRSIQEIKNISIDKQSIILHHYSMRTWRNKGHGSFQLYGHSHNQLPGIGRQMDVGVDTNNFYPWAWEDVHKRLSEIDIGNIKET